MPTVTPDRVLGGVSIDETGVTAVRVFQVSELAGPASGIQYAAATAPGVPRRGDAHPSIPDISADTISVTPQDLTKAEVTVTYRQLNGLEVLGGRPLIEVGTTLTTFQTSRDVSGDQVTLTHAVQEFDGDGNLTDVRDEVQVPTFTIQVPMTTVTYRRKEDRDPTAKSQAYVGLAGDIGPGRREGEGGPPWLCTRIQGTSEDGSQTWDVSYEFQYNPRGWHAELSPTDPNTGQPYIDGKLVRVRIYPSVDLLTPLGLPQIGLPGA